MPNRPPKAWFNRKVEALSRDPDIDDPAAVVGWIWSGLKRATRRRIVEDEETPETPKKNMRMFDPQHLPEPIDIHGYDGSLVRIVPEIDQLIEVQVKMPKHQYDRIADLTKDWEDVEIDAKEGRIVRRAKLNKATNIFIDRG